MKVPAFFRGWISGKPTPAFLLGGEGTGLAEMVAELWLARLAEEGETAELLRPSAPDMERESPVPGWRTPSFFFRFRVVLLPDFAEVKKGPRAEILSYLGAPDPDVLLVIPCSDRNMMRGISAVPGVRASSLREDQADGILAEYVSGLAVEAGKEMAEEVALFLVRWTGGDYPRLRAETAKVLAFSADRKEIGEEEIRQVCVSGGSVDPFRMADDLISRNREACIGQFRRFAASAESSDYHALVGAIAWTVRKRATGQGYRRGGRSGAVSRERAGEVLSALSRIDAGLKGGSGLSPEQLFEIRMLGLLL